jgi:hypothetical protein
VRIAEPIKEFNHTCILTDTHTLPMPLDKKGSEYSRWAEYEFVFRVTGKFEDKKESVSLGNYRAILKHEQIQPRGEWIGQDLFVWTFFKGTNDKEEIALKKERETL